MQTVKLSNGVEMPVLGYGVYQVTPGECECCVTIAHAQGIADAPFAFLRGDLEHPVAQ